MTPAGPNRRGPSARRAHRQECARSANSVRCSGLTPKVPKPTRTADLASAPSYVLRLREAGQSARGSVNLSCCWARRRSAYKCDISHISSPVPIDGSGVVDAVARPDETRVSTIEGSPARRRLYRICAPLISCVPAPQAASVVVAERNVNGRARSAGDARVRRLCAPAAIDRRPGSGGLRHGRS